MPHLAAVVRRNLYAFVIQEGMKALDVMLEQDRHALGGAAARRARRPRGEQQRGEPLIRGHDEAQARCLAEPRPVRAFDGSKALRKAISTTNPIENLNGTIRRVSRRLKRWRGSTMVKRWLAAGVLEAQRGFRKLRGYKSVPALVQHPRQTRRPDPHP